MSIRLGVTREHLANALEQHYRSSGWSVARFDDGSVRARGWGEVTWIGLPVTCAELDDPSFEALVQELGAQRMPTGELCPLELLPDPECADRLRALLDRLRLGERGHIEVYATAA